jgi:hypothetical protein
LTISWWYVYEARVIFYETGLYRESSAYIYDLYKDELNFGHIVQAEI